MSLWGGPGRALAEPERPIVTAAAVDTAPTLDGDVLGDPAWSAALPARDFTQTTPDEGTPASQATEVFIVFTEDALYLGVVCYDDQPDEIIVADSRRDSSLDETDSFRVVFDTFRDRQRGFVFGTNPAAIEYDGQVLREGEGRFGGDGTFNLNWDGSWEVRSQRGDFGWSAEIAIPFRTLRYPRGAEQTWGVNFQRDIRRRNESAFWSPLPRQFDLLRLSMAGTLTGLEVPAQRNLKLTPYVLGEARREGVEGAEQQEDEEAGIDIKFSVTPSLTLDATLNTDFAQVEADEQQINLDRFNLFFPEKRPFFLENAGLFQVGRPGELELFFSRRIGIGPDGEEIPIDGGLRLSGKVGRDWNLGLMAMRAAGVPGIAAENDFYVARLGRDLPNRSFLGAIAIGREGDGPGDDSNRTFGIDGRLGLGERFLLTGFAARTETPGIERDDHAFHLGLRYDSDTWVYSLDYSEVGEGFNPEVGFLTRDGYRSPAFFVFRRVRPKKLWGLHELRPHVSWSGFWNAEDFQESGFLHVDNHWEFKNGYEFHTGINFTREGVTDAFEIFPGVLVPAGVYEHEEIALVFFTNRGAAVSAGLRANIGGFFGGERRALTSDFRFRIRETLNAEVIWTHNNVDLPGGSFDTHLGRLRLTYSFTPRVSLQGLIQYNDRADVWSSNLRFAWLASANTGLFVVYNEQRDIGLAGTGVPGRSLIVKYSRLIDVFR